MPLQYVSALSFLSDNPEVIWAKGIWPRNKSGVLAPGAVAAPINLSLAQISVRRIWQSNGGRDWPMEMETMLSPLQVRQEARSVSGQRTLEARFWSWRRSSTPTNTLHANGESKLPTRWCLPRDKYAWILQLTSKV